MSSESGFAESLRRLKPEKHLHQLNPSDRSALQFLGSLRGPNPKFLLDTTVYIDAVQARLPPRVEAALLQAELWHSTVTGAELAALAGRLDPRHPEMKPALKKLAEILDARKQHRILNPDAKAWRDAGILAGRLARLQHYDKSDYRRVLNDALIFVSAAYHGCMVLTRNVADFDFLMQLAAFGKAVFYERQ